MQENIFRSRRVAAPPTGAIYQMAVRSAEKYTAEALDVNWFNLGDGKPTERGSQTHYLAHHRRSPILHHAINDE